VTPDRSSTLAAASLVSVMFINMLGFGIVIPLLPFYAESFDAAPWQIALIFSAFSMGAFFGEPVWGRMSDRVGRKPLLLSTVSGTLLCYLALAFAPDVWTAFVIRFIGGAASGNGAVMQGYIADVTPAEKRSRRMAWIGASGSLGLVIGPSIGGVFAHPEAGTAGFRVPLLIAAGFSATCLVSILLFIREPKVHRAREETGSRWQAIGEVTRHPVIGRLMLVTFLVGFAFTGIESVFGLWGERRFGWGPREVGWCFAAAGATSGVVQFFVTGPLSERFGEARVLAAGMALTTVGILGQTQSTGFQMTAALLVVTAIGQSVSWPNVGALISRNADPAKQGQVLGLNNATGAFARFVGPLTAGLAFAHVSINAPFVIAAVLVAPAILLAMSATGRARR
jgi:MFS transporter, DHA1 family, tetracycline resistance protein